MPDKSTTKNNKMKRTPIYRGSSILQLKNKLYTHEIAMRICSHQPKMIMWLFHLAVKKQNINK